MKRIFPVFLITGLLFFSLSIEAQVRNYTTQQAPLPCLDKEFSVVLHIVLDSMGDNGIADLTLIDQAFEGLNQAFEPICTKFKICETRVEPNFQYNIIDSLEAFEELLIKEHRPNRINLFLVDFATLNMDDPIIECGFATQNGIQQLETGGIILHKTCLSSVNLSHLFGHYFGLIHTFEGNGTELVDGSNCTTEGDLICDTPADNYTPPGVPEDTGYISADIPCRFINGGADFNGTPYRPDVGNLMSYYGSCRCAFTHDQFLLMVENYRAVSPGMW